MTSLGTGPKEITITRPDGETLKIFGNDVTDPKARKLNLEVKADPRKLLLWLQESPG